MTGLTQVRRLARRIDAATPAHRDRAVDALRALAIAGVIGGHWLVTALVAGASTGSSHGGTVLRDDSPLASMPWLTPLSWVFQTLAVFFLVGGYSAARGYRGGYLPWLRKRMVRLARPVAALAAGWLVPYLLGIAWALGSLRGRRGPALMLVGGVAATAALITWAGYPASMVGVNGGHISNLNPPTLAAVTFGIAQCGLALLMRDALGRAMRRPLVWAAVALVNLSAMTLFIWHETALVTVSSAGLLIGRLPGLLTAPASGLWVAERLAWLPVFAIVLAGLWLALHRVER